jgi:hypothetical protein
MCFTLQGRHLRTQIALRKAKALEESLSVPLNSAYSSSNSRAFLKQILVFLEC